MEAIDISFEPLIVVRNHWLSAGLDIRNKDVESQKRL